MSSANSIGWMKLGLRAQICGKCRPGAAGAPDATVVDATQVLISLPCEPRCQLFVQLPRLAQFLERHRAKPPLGYEDFVFRLLSETGSQTFDGNQQPSIPEATPGPFMNFSSEALAVLERVVALFRAPAPEKPGDDCARQALAKGQLSVLSSCHDDSNG